MLAERADEGQRQADADRPRVYQHRHREEPVDSDAATAVTPAADASLNADSYASGEAIRIG
ncbi:MAG: hypothetical protein ABIQ06_11735 [Caldimonas sp.]